MSRFSTLQKKLVDACEPIKVYKNPRGPATSDPLANDDTTRVEWTEYGYSPIWEGGNIPPGGMGARARVQIKSVDEDSGAHYERIAPELGKRNVAVGAASAEYDGRSGITTWAFIIEY